MADRVTPVRGHAFGWTVKPLSAGFAWTAFGPSGREKGSAGTREQAEFRARNALDRLKRKYGAA